MQGLQRLRGTETGRQSDIVSRVAKSCEVQRQIDRQVWFQGLQRLRGTETGMVARAAKVARYRNRETDRYNFKGCKGCKVQTLIERQVWLQGFQSSQGTETDRQVWLQALQRL